MFFGDALLVEQIKAKNVKTIEPIVIIRDNMGREWFVLVSVYTGKGIETTSSLCGIYLQWLRNRL